jgi:hypothetical protein
LFIQSLIAYSKKIEHTTKMSATGNVKVLQGERLRGPPPALNPESVAVVQPYKDFISKGFITKLVIELKPMGTHVSCSVRDDLQNAGETNNTMIAVGDAKQRIIDKNLWTPGNKGSKKVTADQSKISPKRSLCKEDLLLSDEKLIARALAVAKELGDTVARGRIGSLKFAVEGAKTFDDWWSGASIGEKTRLLTSKAHHESFTKEQHARLIKLLPQCPFRGPLLTSSEEEEEEEVTASRTSTPSSSKALVQKK